MGELVTRLALSHPEISFQFINNGQSKVHTSGNGSLKDVIYHVYGREIAANLLAVNYERTGMKITGFLGKPLISRGNRNFENYFINGRYVKSNMIAKAIEDAYKDFTMQHKYPFVVLHMEIDGEHIDVNVHPTKMELRFNNQQDVYNSVYEAVDRGLHAEEMIPHVELPEPPGGETPPVCPAEQKPEPSPEKEYAAQRPPVQEPIQQAQPMRETPWQAQPVKEQPVQAEVPSGKGTAQRDVNYFLEEMKKRVRSYHEQNSSAEVQDKNAIFKPGIQADRIREAAAYAKTDAKADAVQGNSAPLKETDSAGKRMESGTAKQMDMFEEKFLDRERKAEYKLVGQVFDTYWIVEFHDSLYIIDQHAAHERVLYERTLKNMKTREFTSQYISPPIILDLTMQEAELLNMYMEQFTKVGFEIEEFGQDSYAVRAVPDNLFSIAKKELLMEMIDSLSDEISRTLSPDLIDEKVASMSCKAAVKGNMKLSAAEVDTLINELLMLENPYHCPHGRPTIIAMTKRELEKKFKRIV